MILSLGWELVAVTGGYLAFRLVGTESEMIRTRSGCWLGEVAAMDWRERFDERAAILQHDGGLPQHQAEIRAGRLLASEARPRATLH